MCDYSLMHVKSRPAAVGDKLVVKNFGTGTRGFCDKSEWDSTQPTAVCVLPGTEIAFDEGINVYGGLSQKSSMAIFRQINKGATHMHHDALEFPDGERVLLTFLVEGQAATVLQLPAAPKTEAEAEEQRRVEVVG
jgi:hypothetical protein